MKKALITGITGQDGSFLAEFLLEKGYEVHGITRRASISNTARIDHLLRAGSITLHDGDLSDSISLIKIIGDVQPDEIYNLAAQSHVQVSFDAPEYTGDVDAVGVPQAQLREFLAVDFGACHEDALRDELAVDGVPVDIFRVPVLGLLLAEDQPQGVGLAGRGDDQDQVVLL